MSADVLRDDLGRPLPCEQGDSDDCTGLASTRVSTGDWYRLTRMCGPCAEAYARYIDNYDPPDPDGEDICRDYQAEARDACEAARRLK